MYRHRKNDISSKRKIRPGKVPAEVPLDKTRVEFDEDKIDRIVSDVRDEAHLNARRARQGK
jgi:hypothetical protein